MAAGGSSIAQSSIPSVEALEEMLSQPTEAVVQAFKHNPGDVIILGVGGKMGPTLARMALRAAEAAGGKRKIIGVSRFSSGDLEPRLKSWGVQTIAADLLDQAALDKLPDAPNVVYMAGMKFGSTGKEALTWAMNSYLPGMVSQKYRNSKIVAFSTGNIYGLTPIAHGGSIEGDVLNPMGDYAMSCLGRERIFEHFSRALNIKTALIRLNYAIDMRYGVLFDLVQQIWNDQPINLAMGNFNCIWQADANAMTLAAFDHASSPPFLLNVSGPEILSVRRVCEQMAGIMKKKVTFEGAEAPNALLNNGKLGHKLFGYPRVSVDQMIQWTADWVARGGESLGKPTHFEARDGKF